jgi:hypothetical protein
MKTLMTPGELGARWGFSVGSLANSVVADQGAA